MEDIIEIKGYPEKMKFDRLCFGTLPMAYFHNNFTIEQGAALVQYALKKGITFFDTAELYQTYDILREGLKGWEHNITIASKTHARTYHQAKEHVETALNRLERNGIDIFYIHAPRVENPLQARSGALQCLLDYKKKGVLKHIGMATHRVDTVIQCSAVPEIEIIFALLNISGIGIQGGTREDMHKAVALAHNNGKYVIAMKALGGGNLIRNAETAFAYLLENPAIDSIAVGMTSRGEVDLNCDLFNGKTISAAMWNTTKKEERLLRVLKFCKGCGRCMEMCSAEAITITGNKAKIDNGKCTLCGYCASHCPDFCIRIG